MAVQSAFSLAPLLWRFAEDNQAAWIYTLASTKELYWMLSEL
jgi:hypothetical protein